MYQKEKRPWMLPPEPVSDITGTDTADIVIIGAGYAGVFAARRASELGASVILVEKTKRTHRDTNFFGGSEYGTFNSEFGKALGLPEYDPIDFMLEYQKRSMGRCNADLVRAVAHNSGPAFDWFVNALPQEFRDRIHCFMHPGPKHFKGNTGGFKSFLGTMLFDKPGEHGFVAASPYRLNNAMIYIMDRMEEQGVDIRYGTQALYLEKDETGRVASVIVKNEEGNYRLCGTKAVVLACGDFGGNKDMVYDLLDEYSELSRGGEKYPLMAMGRDGSGIRMGIWAGGHIEPGPRGGMYSSVCNRAGHLGGASFLRLNVHGKRYVNEGLGNLISGFRGSRQPVGFIATIFDADWREHMEYESYEHGTLDFWQDPFTTAATEQATSIAPTRPEGFTGAYTVPQKPDEDGSIGLPKGKILGFPWPSVMYAADTLEELADRLGYAGENKQRFLASIERYNELCRLGRDEDFAKDAEFLHEIKKPPFYGVKMETNAGIVMVTVSGLSVDENQQVIDDDGEPIPGLFATGQCAGEVFPMQYAPPISGFGIGTATALGYTLGGYLATAEL